MQQLQERPPFVRFEVREVEDRNATIAAGHLVTFPVDFALITPPGSRDCIEQVAKDWFTQLESDVRGERFPAEWLRQFRHKYEDWKKGNETPTEGTSIRNWAILRPSQVKHLLEIGCYTIEDVAAANEELIHRIGMGGRELKRQASDYLAAASGPGKLAAEMTALRAENNQLAERNRSLEDQLRGLMQRVSALETPPPEQLTKATKELRRM